MADVVRRYWGPTLGWQVAVEPEDAIVPGFEAFEFFTNRCRLDKGFRLTEASTGMSIIPPFLPSHASYQTREGALSDGIATLKECGLDEFLNKVLAVLRRRDGIGVATTPMEEAVHGR